MFVIHRMSLSIYFATKWSKYGENNSLYLSIYNINSLIETENIFETDDNTI